MKSREELHQHNLKYTKQRSSILKVLKESEIPLTINQIVDSVEIQMDLSTVYRVLDTFEEVNLVNKTIPLEPSEAVYDYNRDIHKHHLTCTVCGKIQIIESCPLDEYERNVEKETNFIVNHHQLELYGICPTCQDQDNE